MENEMKSAIERLCQDMGLPVGDSYTQDWIYELPEKFRDFESFTKYLTAYSSTNYGEAEKRLLMHLMLDITNDLFQQDELLGYQAWNSLVKLLRMEPELHREQIEYWALPGEPLEDAFRLTPVVRSFQEELEQNDR